MAEYGQGYAYADKANAAAPCGTADFPAGTQHGIIFGTRLSDAVWTGDCGGNHHGNQQRSGHDSDGRGTSFDPSPDGGEGRTLSFSRSAETGIWQLQPENHGSGDG